MCRENVMRWKGQEQVHCLDYIDVNKILIRPHFSTAFTEQPKVLLLMCGDIAW